MSTGAISKTTSQNLNAHSGGIPENPITEDDILSAHPLRSNAANIDTKQDLTAEGFEPSPFRTGA